MTRPQSPPPPRTTVRLLTVAETAEFLRLSGKTVPLQRRQDIASACRSLGKGVDRQAQRKASRS